MYFLMMNQSDGSLLVDIIGLLVTVQKHTVGWVKKYFSIEKTVNYYNFDI